MENPKITIKVMKTMGQKIIQLQQRLQDLISEDVHRRVIYSLLHWAEEYGQKRGNGVFISLPLTNRDFANMIGTSRESISRTLNQLKKDNLFEMNREGILIYDPDALKKR